VTGHPQELKQPFQGNLHGLPTDGFAITHKALHPRQ
jgi:hypothetical protein